MAIRRILLLAVLAALSVHGSAQVPERIYGKNKRLMTNAYFLQQMGLWKAVVEREPTNADAWYNYYRANRNAYVVGEEGENKDSRGHGRFDRLQGIVQAMEEHVPGTFETNYVKWLNGYGDPTLFPYLERAHALAPERPEPYLDLVAYYERTGNDAFRDSTCTAYLRLRDYSPGLLAYGYNLLMGLAPNALLIAHGDKDTEAIWLLQGGMGIRRDVRLLNADLLLDKAYRERVFPSIGVGPLPADPLASDTAFAWYRQHLVEHVAANAQGRPVEVSLSADGPYTAAIPDRLYLTGLSWRYSTLPFDPTPTLIANYTERYTLDTLTHVDTMDISAGNVRQFNGNYLPSLLALCDHYAHAGNAEKQVKYLAIAERVAREADRSAEFTAHFQH